MLDRKKGLLKYNFSSSSSCLNRNYHTIRGPDEKDACLGNYWELLYSVTQIVLAKCQGSLLIFKTN